MPEQYKSPCERDHDKLTDLIREFHEYRLNAEEAIRKLASSDFIRQDVYNQNHTGLEKRIVALEYWQARLVGSIVVMTFVGGIAGAVLEHVFR